MMTSPLEHGQVYDHMKMLQSFHGLRRVFGIAATYDEWRVYWLDATDDLAHADALDSPPKDVGEDGDEDEDRRVLHASRVYKRDDPTLPSILASVIVKMHHSLSLGFLPKERRPRIHMNAKAWYWTGSCDVDDYDETEMPPRNARDFILLEDFGCGADGRAWKACTPQQGKVCVLKLAHARPLETSEHRKARLQEECDRWLVVWSMEARVIPLVGDWALLMPYVRPLLTRVLSRPVQAAVDAMATKGYCHEDLVWRHVGCIGEGKEQRVVFFDLGRVTKMEPKIAAERMLQQLREDLKHGLPHA
jgi:hypothetical protein